MIDTVLAQSEVVSQFQVQMSQLQAQTDRNASAIEALTTSVTDLARTVAEEAIQANADRQQAIIGV